MAQHPEFRVFEVFVQKDHLSPHVWVGSVDAGSPEDALIMAREGFLRRDPAVSIWVVPSDAIYGTDYQDRDFFARETDKEYRLVSAYAPENAERWRKYKRSLLDIEKDFIKD
ncbi:MAG TPA: phenylacetic acid degradation protein [Symbiobacteriaceae bacterium]